MDIDEIRKQASKKAATFMGVVLGGIIFCTPLLYLLIEDKSIDITTFISRMKNDPYPLYDFLLSMVWIYLIGFLIMKFLIQRKLEKDEKTREDNEMREKLYKYFEKNEHEKQ